MAVEDEVLEVTEEACAFIIETRAGERDDDRLALYLEVSGESAGAYTYDMWFEEASDAGATDVVQRFGALPVVIPAMSVARLRGAVLEIVDSGLAIRNPNAPAAPQMPTMSVPASTLDSPLELAVLTVIDEEINPQIAMHGGRADLVAVDEDGIAYVRLSGGCQGCGLAQVTLSQGIAVAIRESVPEIVDVVDVTAHEQGENPYFEAAKK